MLRVYKSSAGSGKTFTLVGRYISMLLASRGENRHRRILAVTFTKKATAEMKQRILLELYRLAIGEKSAYVSDLITQCGLSEERLREEARNALCDLLQDYSAFAVTTIDSFFQRVIRAFARELNLQGAYNLELDTKHILQMAVDDYFFALPQDTASSDFEVLMDIVRENIDKNRPWNPKANILRLSAELLKEGYQSRQKEVEEFLKDDKVLADYRAEIKRIIADYLSDYRKMEGALHKRLAGVAETEFSYGKDVFKPFHYSTIEEITEVGKGKKSCARFKAFVDDPEAAVRNKPALRQLAVELHPLAQQLYTMLTGERMRMLLSAEAVLRYLSYTSVLVHVSRCIRETNRELNRLPLAETNMLLGKVIQGEDTPFVYDKIGTRIAHYMIDEFQDTSAMQWANFHPLVAEASAKGKESLLVGDLKQSIYRWRNSDLGLLQTGVKRDFPQLVECALDKNWRSSRVVVEANTHFFVSLAAAAQERYNAALASFGKTAEGNEIQDVYSDVKQLSQRKEEGFVSLHFLPQKKKDERHQAVLENLPALISDLQNRNIPLGKVAFLVRNNAEAVPLAEALMREGIKVVSGEGLLIVSSPEVRFLVNVLRLHLTPDDKILALNTRFDYALIQRHAPQQALEWALSDSPLPDYTLEGDSLAAQVAHLISVFRLKENISAHPYLQALEDRVWAYSAQYPADLYSFLLWWDENANSFALPMQQIDDAVQIVSIHKSKGLEYDVVVIPFCDWDTAESSVPGKADILWVVPPAEPFSHMPLLPLRFGRDLASTVFADDYFRELRNLYLDNLNLTYVAFTRAKYELYVFAPLSEFESGKEDTSNIGSLLHKTLKNELDEDNCYIRGTKSVRPPLSCPEDTTNDLPVYHPASSLKGRLKVRLASQERFARAESEHLGSKIDLGRVMHALLCRIVRREDEDRALHELFASGELSDPEKRIVAQEMNRFWNLVEPTDWFDPKWRVYTERDLLLADGTVKRPDRVMIDNTRAVVVDWKFGNRKSDEYKAQVRDYMAALQEMGFAVKGFLCYVNRKEIITVDL